MENTLRMSTTSNSTTKLITCGRPFVLGALYDYRTDRIVSEMSLWDSNLKSGNINYRALSTNTCEIHQKDTVIEKADLLGMDDNFKMSVLAGLVDYSGSTRLIDDRKTTNQRLQFILKYSMATRLHALTMTYCSKSYAKHPEMFDQHTATHVVTDILYGVDVFFVFDRTISDEETRRDVQKSIEGLLRTVRVFQNSDDDDQLRLSYREKRLANTLTCQYYGDIPLASNPTTVEEVAQLLKELPSKISENEQYIIAKQVWLYPIYLLDKHRLSPKKYYQISNGTLAQSLGYINYLQGLECTLNDFRMNFQPIEIFCQTKQQLSQVIHRIREFEMEVRGQWKRLLPKVRADSNAESALIGLNEKLDYIEEQLNQYIQVKTEEMKVFDMLLNDLRQRNYINLLTKTFDEVQNTLKREFIVRLVIHVTDAKEPFLDQLFRCIDENSKQQIPSKTKLHWWFNQNNNVTSIQEKIASFIRFAHDNADRKDMEFVVDEQYTDEFQMRKGATTILHRNGKSVNFPIPTKPGRPLASDVSCENTTLNWTQPTYGSESIQKYKIHGLYDLNRQWKLFFTTTNAKQSAVLSNLAKGKYQFKIQGVTLAGDAAESDVSDVIRVKPTPPPIVPVVVPPPPKPIVTPPPAVIVKHVDKNETMIDVTPAWFEPVKAPPPSKVKLPPSYNKKSETDQRTYQCLATYRSMVKKTDNIDFVAEPFIPTVDNRETLVVVLNELVTHLGGRLSFTETDFKYNDSAYRSACGVTDLGGIHSMLAAQGNCQTAKFDIRLDLDYETVTATPDAMKQFVLTSIADIATMANCDRESIRVLNVTNRKPSQVGFDIASSEVTPGKPSTKTKPKEKREMFVAFGITTTDVDRTIQIADDVKKALADTVTPKRQGILKHVIPDDYEYKLEPVLSFLQLQPSDFDPQYNIKYDQPYVQTRGGYPYYLPQGWYRHALKVEDKYTDKLWLTMSNTLGEWAVAYHGTQSGAAKSIADTGFLQSLVTRDLMKAEAETQYPSIPKVKGLYVATHCEGGASEYTVPFKVKDANNKEMEYRVVFQCRVQPGKFTEHTTPVKAGKAWRVFDEKAIRPYGLLLKTS